MPRGKYERKNPTKGRSTAHATLLLAKEDPVTVLTRKYAQEQARNVELNRELEFIKETLRRLLHG